jgi:ribosomal protein L11 methyltransferase
MSWRTTFRGSKALLEAADQALTELAAEPVDATSLMRDDDASAEPEHGRWVLHAYTEEPLSADHRRLLPAGVEVEAEAELEDRDWVAHALEGLGLIEAGPFILYGRHDADKVADRGGIKLQVEANQAFGTGHHPTTAGCLEALAELDLQQTNRILDIGTGSGVLAMAARRLRPDASIIASDIDATSVVIAEENAAINQISDITFLTAAGTDDEIIGRDAPYDLVFANILAGPLKELAPDIKKVAAPSGIVILAGLLDEQEGGVLGAYQTSGFTLLARGGTARWPTLTLRKNEQ